MFCKKLWLMTTFALVVAVGSTVQAESGNCHLSRGLESSAEEEGDDYVLCWFTAASDSGVLGGVLLAGTVNIIPHEDPYAYETYVGPTVGEAVDLVAGDDYTLQLWGTGEVSIASGSSSDDETWLQSSSEEGVPSVTLVQVDPVEEGDDVILCSFTFDHVRKSSSKLHHYAEAFCSAPAAHLAVYTDLSKGTGSGGTASSEEAVQTPYVPIDAEGNPVKVRAAKDHTCSGSCAAGYWTQQVTISITLGGGVYVPVVGDDSCDVWLVPFTGQLQCNYWRTKTL